VAPATATSALAPAWADSRFVNANGLVFHCLEAGHGRPVVLLHGFPDHAASWRPLFAQLAPQFRVIAPDLRGYGLTSRPAAHDDYRFDTLVADLAALFDALGLTDAAICGHDWGGVLGFGFAARHPDLVSALIALNAPPASVLQYMIWCDPDQRAASQYITRLRSPDADALFAEANVDRLVEQFLGQPFRQGQLEADDIAAYRAAWTQPGAWQAMLAWYRAAPFDVPPLDSPMRDPAPCGELATLPSCPVQVIWGDRDTAFVAATVQRIETVGPGWRIDHLSDAGHVPHREDPAQCAALIADFLTRAPVLAQHGGNA
jgi:pimeloyl-ACP methyl ester carboxylesterase